jgi:hypothetical protein
MAAVTRVLPSPSSRPHRATNVDSSARNQVGDKILRGRIIRLRFLSRSSPSSSPPTASTPECFAGSRGKLSERVSPLNPLKKRSCSWGSVDLWSEGGAVGNGCIVVHGKTARFACQANCPQIHGPSACRSALQSASPAAESVPIGSRPIARWSIALPGVSGPAFEATDFQLFQSIRQILVRHLPRLMQP